MKRIRQKLQSENGASILFALLFFLVCSMTAASILAAAVSNAGKTVSNREEQQKYLLVSSALQLICDELIYTEYYGRYIYTETMEGEGADARRIKEYQQITGGHTGDANAVMDALIQDLDALFAEDAKKDIAGFAAEETDPNTICQGSVLETVIVPHTFTVTPEAEAFPTLQEAVTITLTVRDTYQIQLTAELEGYRLNAELSANANRPGLQRHSMAEQGEKTTQTLGWTVSWIGK